jgi:predicted DNA-binding transcriptional regulator YafY
MIAELCRAIHERRSIRFGYEPGVRVVEPYAYGVGDGGHELLRAYQLAGDSYSREEGWKLFHVEKMSNIAVLDETFEEPKLGYMRNDPSMTLIYCEW